MRLEREKQTLIIFPGSGDLTEEDALKEATGKVLMDFSEYRKDPLDAVRIILTIMRRIVELEGEFYLRSVPDHLRVMLKENKLDQVVKIMEEAENEGV